MIALGLDVRAALWLNARKLELFGKDLREFFQRQIDFENVAARSVPGLAEVDVRPPGVGASGVVVRRPDDDVGALVIYPEPGIYCDCLITNPDLPFFENRSVTFTRYTPDGWLVRLMSKRW